MNKLVKWIAEKALKIAHVGDHGSIKIACFKSNEGRFYQFIERVLAFVEEVDSRRYKRINKELNWIVNRFSLEINSGKYSKSLKVCSVGYELTESIRDDDVVYFASVLVHEATHGFLCSKGFSYTEESRERIERLCVAEENRFLKKAGKRFPEISEKYIFAFDPADWEYIWEMPRWQKLYSQLRRIYRG